MTGLRTNDAVARLDGAQQSRSGIVLLIVLTTLAAASILAGMVFSLFMVDLDSVKYFRAMKQAAQQAEAGGDYVFSSIRKDANDKILSFSGGDIAVHYAAPAGFEFDTVTNLTQLAHERSYYFTTVGRSQSAATRVEVVFTVELTSFPGLFGDKALELGPGTDVGSYRSSTTTTPTSSTGEAVAGSNLEIKAKKDAVDGTIYLGQDGSGNTAEYKYESSTSSEVVHAGVIDNDPLGLVGGPLEQTFKDVALTNHNTSATGGSLSGGQLEISGNVTLTAGQYYVSDIDLGNNETLTIDATGGPVEIYMTGGSKTWPSSRILVNPPIPENLQIYSNSSDQLRFQPDNTFIGIVYAPLAEIQVQPSGDFYGVLWGDICDVQPGGTVYVDMDYVDKNLTQAGPVRVSSKLL